MDRFAILLKKEPPKKKSQKKTFPKKKKCDWQLAIPTDEKVWSELLKCAMSLLNQEEKERKKNGKTLSRLQSR